MYYKTLITREKTKLLIAVNLTLNKSILWMNKSAPWNCYDIILSVLYSVYSSNFPLGRDGLSLTNSCHGRDVVPAASLLNYWISDLAQWTSAVTLLQMELILLPFLQIQFCSEASTLFFPGRTFYWKDVVMLTVPFMLIWTGQPVTVRMWLSQQREMDLCRTEEVRMRK